MITYGCLFAHSLPTFSLGKLKTAVSAARDPGYGSLPMPAAWIWEEKDIFLCRYGLEEICANSVQGSSMERM